MRTAPIGPSKGMPEIISAAEAALMARMSCGFSWSAREDRADDLDLVAKALRERRTQRAVDESADQDRLVGEFSLAAKERPGNLARGVGALFNVHGEGKEIHSLARGLGGGHGGEQHGVADTRENRAVGELGQVTGFKTHGFVGTCDGTTNANRVCHGCALSVAAFARIPVGNLRLRDDPPLAFGASNAERVDGVGAGDAASDECRADRSTRDSAPRHLFVRSPAVDGVDQ